jgi:exportin-5
MNGTVNGISETHSTLATTSDLSDLFPDFSEVEARLDTLYNPRATNAARAETNRYFDERKQSPQALSFGCHVAQDKSRSEQLRFYGLTLVEDTIKYKWDGLPEDTRSGLTRWSVQLCASVDSNDKAYIRSKAAQIWSESAFRSFGVEWVDMDRELVQLWTSDELEHKFIAVNILAALLIRIRPDYDSPKDGNWQNMCHEIFVDSSLLEALLRQRDKLPELRSDPDIGWLTRLCSALSEYASQHTMIQVERFHELAVQILDVMIAAASEFFPPFMLTSRCTEAAFQVLAVPKPRVQQVSFTTLTQCSL